MRRAAPSPISGPDGQGVPWSPGSLTPQDRSRACLGDTQLPGDTQGLSSWAGLVEPLRRQPCGQPPRPRNAENAHPAGDPRTSLVVTVTRHGDPLHGRCTCVAVTRAVTLRTQTTLDSLTLMRHITPTGDPWIHRNTRAEPVLPPTGSRDSRDADVQRP